MNLFEHFGYVFIVIEFRQTNSIEKYMNITYHLNINNIFC